MRSLLPRTSLTFCLLIAVMTSFLPLAAAHPGAGQAPPSSRPATGSEVTTEAAIPYRAVDGTTLLLDACLPADTADAAPPAVVLVHGGGWTGGRRDAPQWLDLCADLATAGYVVVTVDYRLAPENPFPAAFEDVQAAVEWLREPEQVDRFGIDPARIGILGGSAGGNLAGLVGTAGTGALDTGARVRAVVSLSGPMVLTAEAIADASPEQVQSALRYLGCDDPSDCPAGEAASPISAVDPTDPPFLLVHAEDDPLVAVTQPVAMGEALDAAGVPNEVIIVSGSAHSTQLLDDPETRSDMVSFLDEYLMVDD